MSNKILDTDFLPLDLLITEEGIQNEIGKCNDLRIALEHHQLALVKKLAKLENKKVIKIIQHMTDGYICDYVICNDDEVDDVNIAESLHYEIEDFGDCYETEREVIENGRIKY